MTVANVGLTDLPLITDLSGLSNLESGTNFRLGDCSDPSSGMNGLTSLAGLDSLTQMTEFSVMNSNNLESLAGTSLTTLESLFVRNNPKLSQTAYDALLGQLSQPLSECFSPTLDCPCD